MGRIGRYEVLGELGRGGFGQVFRAFDPTVGRHVAIKTLVSAGDPEMIRRFRNEAASAGKLRHENIVTIFDFGEHEGLAYLVMELLEGEDLERIIANGRALTLLQKVEVMKQAAAGLHHAHLRGVVHRDVKPGNIMLLNDGQVKIMDFGIALLTQATGARITPQGSLMGTFNYMAPEQFNGAPSDSLTDIFSFGVTCYKLIARTHPFHAPEMAGLMFNIMSKPPTPLRSLVPECPEALEEVVLQMLAKDRDARYPNLEDVQFDLEPIIIELRQERLANLLTEASRAIEGDDLDPAQALVRQALEIDPSDRAARDVRERLQRKMRERSARPKVAAMIVAGCSELQARKYEAAIGTFEAALRLDRSNTELQGLIESARKACERVQAAGRLVEEARLALDGGDTATAHAKLSDALAADPGHEQAKVLLSGAQARIEQREREQRLRDGLNRVRELIRAESLDEAIRTLNGLAREFPDSGEVPSLLARVEAERSSRARQARLGSALAELKELVRRRRFSQAAERIPPLQAEFPEAAELRDLAAAVDEGLRAQQQAEAIARVTAAVRAEVEANRFDAAIETLRAAVAQYPSAGQLRDALQELAARRSAYERQAALDRTLGDATRLASEGRYSEALDGIASFVRGFGEDARLEPLRRSAGQGLEEQRRQAALRGILGDAESLLAQDRPDEAARRLRQAAVQFPGDRELQGMFAAAEARAKEQQRNEQIFRTVSEAEGLGGAGKYGQALALVDRALADHPGSERLLRCRGALAAGQAREAAAAANRLAAEGRFEDALRVLAAALAAHPNDPALLELKRTIEANVAARRQAGIRRVLDEAHELIDRGDLLPATQMLQRAAAAYPGEEAVTQLLAAAGSRLEEQQRAEAVARAIREAGEASRAGRFDEAVRIIDAASAGRGADPALAQARDSVIAARKAQERARAVAAACAQARERLAKGRLKDALRTISAAEKRHGADEAFVSLREAVRSAESAADQRGEHPRDEAAEPLPDAPSRKRFAWKAAGIGAGALALAVLGVVAVPRIVRRPAPLEPVLIPVEVRTDPSGADVHFGGRSCASPDCRFEMRPGEYEVSATLKGYEPARRLVTIAPGGSRTIDVTLQPAAPPPAPADTPAGRLLVRSGVANALVLVDGAPRGRTDTSGSLSVTLSAADHIVRVEKQGYRGGRDERVRIRGGETLSRTFQLEAEPARLALRGAPAGLEIRSGGKLLGRTDGSDSYAVSLPSGEQTVQVRGSVRDIAQRFEPGGSVVVDWRTIAPPEPQKPPPPPPPTAEAVEARDWGRVQASSDPAEIERFMANHPGGPHEAQARSRLVELLWQRVDQNDARSLQVFADRFPQSAYATHARSRIAELAWAATDKNDPQRVADYLNRYRNGAHAAEAQAILGRLEKARLETEKARLEAEKQSAQRRAQTQDIHAAIERFNTAFKSRDARAVRQAWEGIPGQYMDAMHQPRAGFVMSFRPTGGPQISGDTAAIACDLLSASTMTNEQSKPVRLSLKKTGDHWVIAGIQAVQ